MGRQARLRGKLQHVAQVLQHVLGRKGLLRKLARQHGLAPVIAQHEAVARPLGHRVQQHRRLHTGALAQHHHLGQRHGVLKDQRIVDEFDHLPAAHLAAAGHVRTDVAQQRLDAFIQGFVGAHHDAQFAALRRLTGPGHRRVREGDAACGKPFGRAAGRRHRGGAQVHDHGRPARAVGQAARGQADPFHLRSSGQGQEHHVGQGRQLRHGFGAARLGSLQHVIGIRVHVECNDLAGMLDGHVAAHRAAHHAQADKADHGYGICCHAQSIHMPPLISSDVPVIQLEAGEHRNSAACAISSGLP
ncbi:hypothetical protein D3C71_1320760 [compost metagenome]